MAESRNPLVARWRAELRSAHAKACTPVTTHLPAPGPRPGTRTARCRDGARRHCEATAGGEGRCQARRLLRAGRGESVGAGPRALRRPGARRAGVAADQAMLDVREASPGATTSK